MSELAEHPAKFSTEIMQVIAGKLPGYLERGIILDPFAGVGGVHELQQLGYSTIGVEVEAEWAIQHEHTRIGDATDLWWLPHHTFDAVVTSPCYGNRMADHHNARDDSKRHTYKHYLGRDLSANSAGAMQWGDPYRSFHERAWDEANRVLKPGGVFVLNISNHYRKGVLQKVTEWHLRQLMDRGMSVEEVVRVPTKRMRHGANRGKRAEFETVAFMRKDK